MRISDWSSDVCSSDLSEDRQPLHALRHHRRLPEQVTSKSQQRDGAAETADHFGRHRAEASVQHRIGRPSQRAGGGGEVAEGVARRSEEHTSELQSLMRISYAVFCLNKKIQNNTKNN